ncbi:MAG TPA: hypothetical protein VGY55_18330 [Pirellulales bacterium]|jgi:hypothetical protein|nr:hypothetical protein [Pirellulales bacterium]
MRAITGVAITLCGAAVFIATSERHVPRIPSGILFAIGALIVLTQFKAVAGNVRFFPRETGPESSRDRTGIASAGRREDLVRA